MNETKRGGASKNGTGGGSVTAMFQEAVANHEAGRLDEALALYRDILTINPHHADALHMQGVLALQRDEPEAGIALIRQSLHVDPKAPRVHYNLGLALQAAGDRAGALAAFQNAAQSESRFVEAHNNVGALLIDEPGKLDEAVAAFERALALNPSFAEAHNNLAVAHKRRGELGEASRAVDQALALAPEHVPALNTRATILLEQGAAAEAEATLRKALALAPQDQSALNNLGLALKDLGRIKEAEETFKKVVALQPSYAEAHNNIGACLQQRSELYEALEAFETAAEHDPQNVFAQRNLGGLHRRLGNGEDALVHYRRAVVLAPDDLLAWQGYADAVRLAQSQGGDPKALWEDLVRCLAQPGIDHSRLGAIPGRMIRERPEAAEALRAAQEGQFSLSASDVARGGFVTVFGGGVLVRLLGTYVQTDPQLELMLTIIRRILLGLALEDRLPERLAPETLAFICALAEQCFHNGFVYRLGEGEADEFTRFREKIEARFLEPDDDLPLAAIALYGCYWPLEALPDVERVLNDPRVKRDSPFDQLRRTQIEEPRAEAVIAATFGAPTRASGSPIDPRWIAMVPERPHALGARLAELFPEAAPFSIDKEAAILVAGCGTGLLAIAYANRHVSARVTAIDSDAAALAYGRRMADRMGDADLQWQCGDPLGTGLPNGPFDLIACPAALDRAEDPAEALAVLRERLKPGGVILLGVLDAQSYEPVEAARAKLGEGAADVDAIRAFRHEVFTATEEAPYKSLALRREFFSLPGCQALLAPEPRNVFDLGELAGLLESLDLEFLGMDLTDQTVLDAYRARYPEDPQARRLDLWEAYAALNPENFAAGHRLWLRWTGA